LLQVGQFDPDDIVVPGMIGNRASSKFMCNASEEKAMQSMPSLGEEDSISVSIMQDQMQMGTG